MSEAMNEALAMLIEIAETLKSMEDRLPRKREAQTRYGSNPKLSEILEVVVSVLGKTHHASLDEIMDALPANKMHLKSTNPRRMFRTYMDRILDMPNCPIYRTRSGWGGMYAMKPQHPSQP